MRLEGKVALISGGSRGMGAFEAELFLKEGAKVVVGDVREEEGRALVDKIGDDSVFVRLDVTSESDWAAAVNEAVDRYGKLDLLVHNAGISARGSIEAPTGDVSVSIPAGAVTEPTRFYYAKREEDTAPQLPDG